MADLRFTTHPTPVGDVFIAATADGIVSLHPLRESLDHAVSALGVRLDMSPVSNSAAGAKAAKQIDEYFAGRRRRFALRLDWRLVHGFTRAALDAVCEVPYGETAGYGEIAAMAGSPRAARAVGTACATTPFSIVVPVHRVIRADGSLGEYGGHPELKEQLLRLEKAVAE